MNEIGAIDANLVALVLWGFIASAAMATLLEGAQLSGRTRMSLPFLFGAFVSGNRRSAIVFGYVLYLLGGWAFAVLYALCLQTLHFHSVWESGLFGLAMGLAHGLFLIAVFLPLLPYIHPRLATDYDGAAALARLEPPGPFGLNYGWATPLVTVLAQALFGVIFGLGYGAAIATG
jgi:hypothetical protein